MDKPNDRPTRFLNDEHRFQMLIDAVVDYAIFMLDPDGYVTSWNTGAERIKGYLSKEAIGQHFSRFFTPEDQVAGRPLAALATARKTGRHEEEGWRVRKDGTRFWALAILDSIRDSEGNLLGFAKITRDVTERRMAALALESSERRFRLLVDAVVDYALYMIDTEGNVTNWNKGAERIKGYSAEEIVGQNFSRFYTAEDQETGFPAKALAIASRKGKFEAEGWRVRKNGERFFAHVIIDAVRDEKGELIGFAKITRDMTERRAAQLALEKAREDLHQSQKMEALGHLTGGVAHDFNNVLTAIIGNLDLARRNAQEASSQRLQIEAALQAAQNGAAVVRQMLAFARKQPLQMRPVELNKAVEEVSLMVGRSCNENIEIETDLAPDLKTAIADPNQLQTSILNLALNACDAMPEGGTLKITTANKYLAADALRHLSAGDYVSVIVSDTGFGMTPEILEHALEPFFTTKEIGKGTGLGLSTVYGTARQLGGTVRISSTVGEGTSVEMLLPASVITDSASDPADLGHVDLAAQEEARAAPVLYVEDDFLVSMATLDILEGAGLSVFSAPKAEEALDLLDQHPEIGLLLTDIGLPGMSGHELAAEARRRRPDLKIMFLTGYDRGGPMAGTPADDITRYMDKPYEPKALIKLVREMVNAVPQAAA